MYALQLKEQEKRGLRSTESSANEKLQDEENFWAIAVNYHNSDPTSLYMGPKLKTLFEQSSQSRTVIRTSPLISGTPSKETSQN